jgi:hypothetical protein
MDLRVLVIELSEDEGDVDVGGFDGGSEFPTCHGVQLRGRTKRRDANRQDNIDLVVMFLQ